MDSSTDLPSSEYGCVIKVILNTSGSCLCRLCYSETAVFGSVQKTNRAAADDSVPEPFKAAVAVHDTSNLPTFFANLLFDAAVDGLKFTRKFFPSVTQIYRLLF